MNDLKERVDKFNAMSLPGQTMGMHMGTSYLVNDLWGEVEQLRAEYDAYRETALVEADLLREEVAYQKRVMESIRRIINTVKGEVDQ